MASTPGIVLNGAVSQYDRWLRALDPDYAQVDGRTYAELLDFSIQYAELIRFYNLSNEPEGNWVEFFLLDPVMVLAGLATIDVKSLEAEYDVLERKTAAERDYEKKFELLRATFAYILDLARQINAWLAVVQRIEQTPAVAQLDNALVQAINDSLRDALRTLKAYDEGAGLPEALGTPIGLDYSGFLPVWNLGCVCPDGSIYRGRTRQRKIDSALPHLEPLFYAFWDAIVDSQAMAGAALQSLLFTGDHKPQIALYMTFVQLFSTAQRTINTMSNRYADFYYRRVLRESPSGPLPDNVYLTFTLATEEGVDRATVPAATLFPAGQDAAGNEIVYSADRSLTVTTATLAKIYTLRVEEAPPGSGTPSRILQAEIPIDALSPWPTFGTSDDKAAALGFAISSPYLLLTGGDRYVAITFDYDGSASAEVLATLVRLTGMPEEKIVSTVLKNAFTLFGTSTGKWFEVGPYDADVPAAQQFRLSFTLPATAPPLTMFGDEGEPAMTTPTRTSTTLAAWLRQEEVELTGPHGTVAIFPLSLLSGFEVQSFEICTDSPIGDLVVENTDGAIDPSAPFPAFGGGPVVGSYLQVRSVELFAKRPEKLTLIVQWFGLPPNEDGFRGWYRDYEIGLSGKPEPDLFDNTTFVGGIDVANPGWWGVTVSSPPGGDVYLFRTTNDCFDPEPRPDGTLCGGSTFDDLDIVGLEAPAFYTPDTSALRLRITGPPYAFGNSIYGINVLNAVLADLPDSTACQDRCLVAVSSLQTASRMIGTCLNGCPESETSNECLQPCLEKCLDWILGQLGSPASDLPEDVRMQLLTTASCLDACLNSSPPMDLRVCALECQTELEAAYTNCLTACLQKCTEPKKELRYPNEPYLPIAESVQVTYTARANEGTLYHLLPFGSYATAPLPSRLLPRFDYEAALHLGFNGLVTPETLTMLVQMTSEEKTLPEPPVLTWEYLSANRWTKFQSDQVLADTTNGLRNTGMVALAVPRHDGSVHTVMPAGVQWIRVSVTKDVETFPDTASIVPHVVTATWQGGNATGESLATPLPAGTIASSVQNLPHIASIAQPMASFGGRPPEDDRAFRIRVGERLRHKDRAVLGWDYDRLVLERFPTIWKSATLPPSTPGHVTVMVVPGDDGVSVVDPATPMAPGHVLARIGCYLQTLTSPFVQLKVVNPQYVRIRVDAVVEFQSVDAEGGSIDRLNNDLVQYLSPWFYDAERAEKQGRYASEDEISEFIQTRPYVASLQTLSFRYDPDPATLDWYFLTSAARHDLREADVPYSPCGRNGSTP